MIRDLIALPDTSKVWVYQGNKELSYDQIDFLRPKIYEYVDQWASHGKSIEAYGNVFHKRFIVFVADESELQVSGCSIDGSVHFVKWAAKELDIDFFDRMNYAIMSPEEEISTIHHIDFKQSFDDGLINENSLVFDNLVNTKTRFLTEWIKPLKDSWHYKFVN